MGVDRDLPNPAPNNRGREASWLGLPPSRLSWDDLRTFLAVSVHGSMNRAAAALGESQPTVSRRMRRLEEMTGLTLFDRRPNMLKLSEAGQALFEAIAPMAQAASDLVGVINHFAPPVDRPIRITATTTLALFLSEHVARLRMAALSRDIVIIPTRLRADLLRGEADLALRMNTVEEGVGLLVRKVAVVSFAFYALGNAKDLPVIMPSGNPNMSKHRALADCELAHRRQGPQIDELHLRYQAIRAGAGIGSLPCWLGDADPLLERISIWPDQFIHEEVFLVRTERSRQDHAIEAVAQQLSAILHRNRTRLKTEPPGKAPLTPPPSPASVPR